MKDYLLGQKVKLVKFLDKHITSNYIEWLNDHKVNRFMFTGRVPISRYNIKIPDNSFEIRFAIITNLNCNNNDTFIQECNYTNYIGTATISSIDWISRRAEIGYMIGNINYWGVGIASETVQLLSDYCLNRLNLNKIEAGVVEGNDASVKVLEKNGFKQYATIPQEYYLEGKYLDTYRFFKLQK